MIIRNEVFYPEKINASKINEIFDGIDDKYQREFGKFYKEEKAKHPEIGVFLQETPPEKTEVSKAVLDMIK